MRIIILKAEGGGQLAKVSLRSPASLICEEALADAAIMHLKLSKNGSNGSNYSTNLHPASRKHNAKASPGRHESFMPRWYVMCGNKKKNQRVSAFIRSWNFT